MSALAVWVLLAGLIVVPVSLLWAGGRMHRRSDVVQAAFRGGSIGFMLAVVMVVGLLMIGPHHWPPDSAVRLWAVVLALPIATGFGAGLGLWADRG